MKAFRYLKLSVFVILTLVAVQACTLSEYIFVTATPSEPTIPNPTPTPTSYSPEIIANGQIAYIDDGNVWRYILSTGESIQVTTQDWNGVHYYSYFNPYISPDGRYVAYGKYEFPDNSIYISDLLDGTVVEITGYGEFLGWTGQGYQFFAGISNQKDITDLTSTGRSFYWYDLANLSSPELLASLSEPGISPLSVSNDGKWAILNIYSVCPYLDCRIDKLWNLSTAKEITPPPNFRIGIIDFSPDSEALVLSARPRNDYAESPLYVANIGLSDLTPIVTEPNATIQYAKWSPDGQWIAYHSVESDPSTIDSTMIGVIQVRVMLVRPDGSDLTMVEGDGRSSLEGWSPDGSKLLYWQDATLMIYEISSGLKQPLPFVVDFISSHNIDWGNLLQ